MLNLVPAPPLGGDRYRLGRTDARCRMTSVCTSDVVHVEMLGSIAQPLRLEGRI